VKEPASQRPYPHLFAPLTIRGVSFRNRVMASPVTDERLFDGNGMPTPACIAACEAKARGGAGAVTAAAVFVDIVRGGGLALTAGMTDMRCRERILTLVESIKGHGAVASVQLNHAGAIDPSGVSPADRRPMGPTGYVRPDGVTVEEMTPADMKAAAEAFAQAAAQAQAAGFQMVMLQGGHGWLLHQFLSPLTNRRTDKFGGSMENRARFPLMVIRAVRQAVGPQFPIEYRVSGSERTEGGLDIAQVLEFCRLIQNEVDMLHVTGGLYSDPEQTGVCSSAFQSHGCDLGLASAVKQAVHVPVTAVGGFTHPQQIEDALAAGGCDMVALGRQLIADPAFAQKAAEGRTNEIAPCQRCGCCTAAWTEEKGQGAEPLQCMVEPYFMRWERLRAAPPVLKKQKVLVVGGGVGGMYAAVTAAQRGHEVRLVEMGDRLGGALWYADEHCHKQDLAAFRDCLAARCVSSGVQVVYKTRVDGAYIRRFAPDQVILAIGGEPVRPAVPGLAVFAHPVWWAYAHPEMLGQRVVIIGSGLAGVECAMHLAEQYGRQVTVLGRSACYASRAYSGYRRAMEQAMPDGVTIKNSVTVTEVRPQGVTYRARNGRSVEIEADTVLYAVGTQPKRAEVISLLEAFPHARVIGDCHISGRVLDAVRDGLFAGYDIT
jgi:2,4-dienoyl-CoA reductase-like NADH-dependent reductase (Old Yellow Enzyme family)/thioredoxin reductase